MPELFGQNHGRAASQPATRPPLPPGMLEEGNIDLLNRPVVKNQDGSISTVRSISVNFDGKEVLIPTVSDDGRIMSDEEAIEAFRQTGRHLGAFADPDSATKYAMSLHEDQARGYDLLMRHVGRLAQRVK